MKRYKLNYYLPIAILFFVSCLEGKKNGGSFKEIKVEGSYLISLPEQMKPTTSLNADASLQYQDSSREIYLIVLEESKVVLEPLLVNQKKENQESSILSDYAQMQLKQLGQTMKIKRKKGPKKLYINKLSVEFFEVAGTVPKVKEDLFYTFTFIEGEEKMYTLMSWTLDSQKDKYKPIFEQIGKSFELIN